jgi:transcriptional regulator with XRE-family HTH domain
MTQAMIAQARPEWDLADRMRKALRESGTGVQEMADYLDVSRTAVSTWINGRIRPGTQTLMLWAQKCGVSYDWLVSGTCPKGGDCDWQIVSEKNDVIIHRCTKCGATFTRPKAKP